MTHSGDWDVDSFTKEDGGIIADAIEKYLDRLDRLMIIPEELMDDSDEFLEAIKFIRKKLLKKLRKGNKSVFKDMDEWNLL